MIFFIASGDGTGTQRLWNNGTVMLRSHICQTVFDEENVQLVITKITKGSHRLAVQVLSKSVANILRSYYPCETHKTAEFCEMMNQCLIYPMFKIV